MWRKFHKHPQSNSCFFFCNIILWVFACKYALSICRFFNHCDLLLLNLFCMTVLPCRCHWKVVVVSPLEGTVTSFVSKYCRQISFHYFFLWVVLGQEWEIQEGKNAIVGPMLNNIKLTLSAYCISKYRNIMRSYVSEQQNRKPHQNTKL